MTVLALSSFITCIFHHMLISFLDPHISSGAFDFHSLLSSFNLTATFKSDEQPLGSTYPLAFFKIPHLLKEVINNTKHIISLKFVISKSHGLSKLLQHISITVLINHYHDKLHELKFTSINSTCAMFELRHTRALLPFLCRIVVLM